MKQQIAVIGLGRFGSAVAEGLMRGGHEVLGIDVDMTTVQRMSGKLSQAVQADANDEDTLERLGVRHFDAAVVGIGANIESSILITLLLKRMGVKHVVAKALSDVHGEILTRTGADRVVFPERDTGLRLAYTWGSPSVTDSLTVVEGYSVVSAAVPDRYVGQTIESADLNQRYGVTLLMLARGSKVMIYPRQTDVLQSGDVLVVAGDTAHLERLFA